MLLYGYFHGKFSNELHSSLALVQTFTAKTRHATHIVVNHVHSLRILLVRCSHRAASSRQLLLFGNDSQEDGPRSLQSQSLQRLTVIFFTYPHKMCFLLCNPLPRVYIIVKKQKLLCR